MNKGVSMSVVTEAHKAQFEKDGYFVLEGVIPPDHLDILRGACQKGIAEIEARMDAAHTDVQGLNHRGSRYFVSGMNQLYPEVRQFVFSPLMADVCEATIGPDAFLFFEQYVVKAAEKGMKFSWHQDSGYVGYPHRPYLTCWCTLDDVNEENGTVSILPYDRAGTRTMIPHTKDPVTNDLVGYFGDDKGIPVIAPAGSIAVFASTVFHSSGFNSTDKMRRIYLAQYAPEVIRTADGTGAKHYAEAFLENGKLVATA